MEAINAVLKGMDSFNTEKDYKQERLKTNLAEESMSDGEIIVAEIRRASIVETKKGPQVVINLTIQTQKYKEIEISLWFKVETARLRQLYVVLKKLGVILTEYTEESINNALSEVIGKYVLLKVVKYNHNEKVYTNYYVERLIDSIQEATTLAEDIKQDAESPF